MTKGGYDNDILKGGITMADIKDFKNEKLVRDIRKIYIDFENKDSLTIHKETYQGNLYFYACGQAGDPSGYYAGWLKGVEFMMGYMGIDYKALKEEVKQKIQSEGREIINDVFFDDEE